MSFSSRTASRGVASLALLIAGAVLVALPAHAQLVTYTSLSSFQAAFPVTTLEDFERGTGAQDIGTGPLDSSTNNSVFRTGDIVNGLRLNFPGQSPNEYFFNINAFGQTGVITTGNSRNSVDLTLYNNNATAVGFDLYADSETYNYEVFSSAGNRLGTGSFLVVTKSFLGFSNLTSGIGRVTLSSPNFETIDNVRFNAGGVSAPEPTAFALLALPLAGMMLRRRKAAR